MTGLYPGAVHFDSLGGMHVAHLLKAVG